MQYTISHTGLVNMPWLGISDVKALVWSMLVLFGGKIMMERKDVIGEVQLIELNILLFTFAASKIVPGSQEVIRRYDTVIGMSELNAHTSSKATPPQLSHKQSWCRLYCS